jgi:hypothetical protein
VLADIHSFKFSGSITGLAQTPDGSIILTGEKYGEGPFLMGGFPDGSNWKTMVSFQYDPLGNYLSNLIPKSDGYLYGVTWEYYGVVRFFKINQTGQDFSFFYETIVPDFGNQISLNLGGSAYQIMAQMLPAQTPTGWWPEDLVSCLFEGSDGYLYGTVGDGRIFKIKKNGNGFTILFNELHHRSNFIEHTDGMLYWDPSNHTLHKTSSYYSRLGNSMLGQDGILYFGKGKYNPESNLVTPLNLGCAFFPDLPSNYQIAAPAEGCNGFLYGRKTTSNSNDGHWLPMAWSKDNGACEMSISWDISLGNHGVFAFETSTASTPTLQPDLTDKIMLSPNPTSASTQLSVALEAPTELHLLVLDVLGRSVFESNQNRAEGTQTFEIPASALWTKGVYHVVLKSETSTWSRLLLVQ